MRVSIWLLTLLLATPAVAAPAAKKPPPQARQVLGPIANFAAQNGVGQCLGRIDQVSNFLTNGAVSSGAAVFLPPQEPDRSLTSVSMEVLGNNGLSYVNTAYSPSANGCDAVYEAVTYWAGSCEQVAASFPGFNRGNPIRQYIQTLEASPTAKVYLMPAGQGCISIKKEVVY